MSPAEYAAKAASFAKPGAKNPAYLFPELLTEGAELVDAVQAHGFARANVPGELIQARQLICHEGGDNLWMALTPPQFGLPGITPEMISDELWTTVQRSVRGAPITDAITYMTACRAIAAHQNKSVRDPEDAARRRDAIARCFSPHLPLALAKCLGHFGLTLQECAKFNIAMLEGRLQRGTIGGMQETGR